MQKKLIALAIAGLSSAAFAQSNVTVYGVGDVTFEVASATGATAPTATAGSRGSFTRVNSNSSHIGFKGAETLGNGLTAVFQVETGVAYDNNSNGIAGAFSARDTFVGLAGGFGTVVAGTLTGPTRGLGARMDLNAGATGPGANSSIIGKPIGSSGAGVLDTRLGNTIAYVSPTFSGFNAIVGYMSGENKSVNDAADTAKKNLKAWDLGLNYINGPIDVGFAYASVRAGTNDNMAASNALAANPNALTTTFVTTAFASNPTTVSLKSWNNYRLAGAYTFTGGHKIVALYDKASLKVDADNLAATDINKLKRTTWGLGGKFMVTPAGGLIAQYYRSNKLKIDGTAVDNTGAALWEIGYEHSLSKRTMLKASFSELKNKSADYYDFNVGAVNAGAAISSLGTAATGYQGADPKVFAVGVRHSF